MNIAKKCTALLAAALCISIAGCGGQAPEAKDEQPSSAPSAASAPASTSSAPESKPSENASSKNAPVSLTANPDAQKEATLYIGMAPDHFQTYPLSYSGELTPELLIQGISELTWWDLTLADAVTTGKGGMTVCFADTSSLFVGPPDPQNEEFHAFGAEDFSQSLLDSIQKTLQMNFTGAGGNPDALDIYYCMSDNRPLTIPNLELSWPIDQPYHWIEPGPEKFSADNPQEGGADSAIIAYLQENLSGELGDLSQAKFTPDEDQMIAGDTCRVFNITVNRGNADEWLGSYAVVSGLSGIYKFNVQTAEFEEYAHG